MRQDLRELLSLKTHLRQAACLVADALGAAMHVDVDALLSPQGHVVIDEAARDGIRGVVNDLQAQIPSAALTVRV